jgi:Tfp pilus assembly protein PilO
VQVKTKNALVVGLAVFLVVLLWYRVMYSPLKSSATKANDATEQAESQANTLRAQIAKQEKQEKDSGVNEKVLKTAVPVDDELTTFLRTADGIRDASGVIFQSVTPSAPTIVNNFSTIGIVITAQGTYRQVHDYVQRLLDVDRIFIADNVAFTAAGSSSTSTDGEVTAGGPTGDVFAGTGSAPLLQVQVTGRLFHQPPAGALVGSGAAAQPAATPAQP